MPASWQSLLVHLRLFFAVIFSIGESMYLLVLALNGLNLSCFTGILSFPTLVFEGGGVLRSIGLSETGVDVMGI